MKKKYTILLSFCTSLCIGQNVNFTDQAFKNKVLSSDSSNQIATDFSGNYFAVDANADGEIQLSEAILVKTLSVNNSTISNFGGIQSFSNMEEFDCSSTGRPSRDITLDISGMPNLKKLACRDNRLLLGISSFSNIEFLDIYKCSVSATLDFTAFSNLKHLYCGRTFITGIDITGLTLLEDLDISYTQFPALDISTLTNLKTYGTVRSDIESIDASGLIHLEQLTTRFSPLSSLNVNGCNALRYIDCTSTNLLSLNASNLPALQELIIQAENFASLTINGCPNLNYVSSKFGMLTSLDASNLPNLTTLNCSENNLQDLNVSGSSNLLVLDCGFNELTTLDCNTLTHLQSLTCIHNQLTSLYVKNGIHETAFYFNANPNLSYICADESQVPELQIQVTYPLEEVNPECVVDSSCNLSSAEFHADKINIYPNPSDNIVYIDNLNNDYYEVKLTSLLGKVLIQNNNSNVINISSLSKGIYILTVKQGERTLTQKLIKN
jgi:Secretion system C-terminal sorting domain